MIIKRILFSLAVAAVISVSLAVLGLISTARTDDAVVSVIEVDLPATEHLGDLGRHMMSIQSSLNALLNPDLTPQERLIPHKAYEEAKEDLSLAMAGVVSYFKIKEGDARINAVATDWLALESTTKDWLNVAEEIVKHYRLWEDTSILNTTALLMNLEKYRGDHFYLVRRMSEMITNDEVIGPEIDSNAGLCAFGRWQASFLSGQDSLSGNPRFREAMDKMNGPHTAFHATAAEIYRLLKDGSGYNSGRVRQQYTRLLSNADQVIGNFEIMIKEAGRAQAIYQQAADLVADQLLPLGDKLQKDLSSLMATKRAYDLENNQAVIKTGQRFILAMTLGGALTVILLSAISFVVPRNIKKIMSAIIGHLNEAADQVDQNSARLSHASSVLAEGAVENSASLEQSSAALEELSSMTRRNADNAVEANSLMTQATVAIGQADSSMSNVIGAMDEISISGNEISKIIKTIDEIAFQTNLLALNAAVEAARAGEAGSGFAVVADEVRNLAIRSAEAAKSTSGLIAATISNINSGSSMVQATAEAFQTVRGHSSKVAELLAEVAEASKEQAQGIDQITMAMNQMDKVTQSNAASAEESAGAASRLSAQAGQLLSAVMDLESLIHSRQTEKFLHGSNARRPAPHQIAPVSALPGPGGKPKNDDDFFDF